MGPVLRRGGGGCRSQSTQLSAEQKEAQFRDGWKQLVLMCARAQKRKEQNIQEVYISNASVTAQLGALGCASLLPRQSRPRNVLALAGNLPTHRVNLFLSRSSPAQNADGACAYPVISCHIRVAAAEVMELTLRTTQLGVLGDSDRAKVSRIVSKAMSSLNNKAGPKAALRSINLVCVPACLVFSRESQSWR